jgi:carnitine 3-dehydrogenase
VAEHWKTAASLGTIEGASPSRLRFAASVREAVSGVEFVQESGPERLDLKQILFKEMDEVAPPGVVIASSSSGILISEIQTACAHPERVLIGHPFNPPHLIPLVEVVGGKLTGASSIETALGFYRAIGKHPIHIKREVKGHVANRLQAALWREAFGLVQNGVASVADIDAAISHGPGLRWALLGPFLNLHLSGGAGGMQHMLDHLGPPINDWWADLYSPTITDEIKREIVAGSAEQTAGWDMKTVQRERDEVLIDLLVEKSKAKHLP